MVFTPQDGLNPVSLFSLFCCSSWDKASRHLLAFIRSFTHSVLQAMSREEIPNTFWRERSRHPRPSLLSASPPMGILGTRKPRSSKIKQPRRCRLERQSRVTSRVTTALSESPPSPLSPGGKHTATQRLPHLRNIPGPRRVLKPGVTQDLVTSSTPSTAAIAPAPEETAGQPVPHALFPLPPQAPWPAPSTGFPGLHTPGD